MSLIWSAPAFINCDIKTIHRSLPIQTAIQLINSFVISHVDYYNVIVPAVPIYQLDKIQSQLNVAARFHSHYDHLLDLLKERFHWLCVPQRITFKCSLQVYNRPQWPFR